MVWKRVRPDNALNGLKNVIYEGTPHGKAELAYFYFHFLLVLNLIYFAAEYVELYRILR